jgi:hypothetical protein
MKFLKGFFYLLAVGLLLTSPNTYAGARVVNCDKGDSLQKTLQAGAGSAAPLEIQLLGTCYEAFTFSRDRVTINGDGNTTIVGDIRIFASDQVHINDLTITGPGPGITVFNGRARLMRVNLMGNEDAGVYARQGASINFSNSRISDNHGEFGVFLENSTALLSNTEVIGNWGHGVAANLNSSVSLANNSTVHANQGDGVQAKLGSVVNVANSHIWGNRDIGISMSTGAAGAIHDSAVNANGQGGIDVWGNSTLDVYGGMVGWNGDHGLWLTDHSFLRLINAQVSYNLGHGLIVARDGGAVLEGNSVITGNTDENFQIVCQGKEASIEIVPPAYTDSMNCPDPDF